MALSGDRSGILGTRAGGRTGEQAAVDIEFGAGDVGGFVGGEQYGQGGDFFGHAEAAQWGVADNSAILAARSGPLPSSGSHMGVRMAAGWIELQRICSPCSAQYRATDLV